MLNRVEIIGNLGRDPEVRSTQAGKQVASLSVATTHKWKDRNTGEAREKTECHRVTIFNEHLVKAANEYLHKGDRVYLSGSLATRKWTDQQGAERWTTEIILGAYNAKLIFLSPKIDSDAPHGDDGAPTPTGTRPPGPPADLDDDIPF